MSSRWNLRISLQTVYWLGKKNAPSFFTTSYNSSHSYGTTAKLLQGGWPTGREVDNFLAVKHARLSSIVQPKNIFNPQFLSHHLKLQISPCQPVQLRRQEPAHHRSHQFNVQLQSKMQLLSIRCGFLWHCIEWPEVCLTCSFFLDVRSEIKSSSIQANSEWISMH